jgi:hypothetical protein
MSNATLSEEIRLIVHQEVDTPGAHPQRRFSMARRLGRVDTLRR